MKHPADSDTAPTFRSHAPGYWPDAAMGHWHDARWQLRHRVDTLAGLEERLALSDVERAGVLLAGHKRNAYWYGSQLSIDEARKLAPFNNATSLQVTAACLSGMVSAMENPHRGLLEPEDLDFGRNLEICKPYLGPVVGKYTDWTPLHDRERLFPEDLDKSDPWQFKNVRVVG